MKDRHRAVWTGQFTGSARLFLLLLIPQELGQITGGSPQFSLALEVRFMIRLFMPIFLLLKRESVMIAFLSSYRLLAQFLIQRKK